jgi:putative FmdB family regulatory protein
MPQYTFRCGSCNLQFKRKLAMGVHPTCQCPICKKGAPREWEGQGFGFGFQENAATAKGNSGVAKHDYPTADNIVGRSAEAQWNIIHERNAAKDKIRGQGVGLARRDHAEKNRVVTEYTTLSQGGFAARKRLEGTFKAKAARDGIEAPLKGVSTTAMKKDD